MSRVPVVVGNWKLQKTIDEATSLATELKNQLSATRGVEVGIAPVFTALHPVARRLDDSRVGVAAQDCYWEERGAFTGEVSASLLADVGCRYCIIGHSERRHVFGETDDDTAKKTRAAIDAGLTAILCVGEQESERDAGKTMDVVERQLRAGIMEVGASEIDKLIIAYEPVWAIGTGRTATPAQAQEVHEQIRALLTGSFGDAGAGIRIQYGGSVKPGNAAELLAQPDIDGALVGGASLVADSFVAIVRAAQPA